MGLSDGRADRSRGGRHYQGPHPASPEGHAGLSARLREKREPEEGAIREWYWNGPEAPSESVDGRSPITDQGGRP
jgi:hypothetical protein